VIRQMSAVIPCPRCGTENHFQTISVIDVDDQPDWRDEIIERTLSQKACKNCGTSYRKQPKFSYFDRKHDQWIVAFPWEKRDEWRESEQQAQSLYDAYFHADTSMSARMREAPLNRRVTFGWEALREKIVVAERSLDDVRLELLKRELQQRPSRTNDDDVRLLDADEAELILGVIPPSEGIVERMTIPRGRYDAIGDDLTGRAPRAELSKGMYVDLRRLKEERRGG